MALLSIEGEDQGEGDNAGPSASAPPPVPDLQDLFSCYGAMVSRVIFTICAFFTVLCLLCAVAAFPIFLCMIGFTWLTLVYWQHCAEVDVMPADKFWSWFLLGLVVPVFAWNIFNARVIPGFVPFVPELHFSTLKGAGFWKLVAEETKLGSLVIASCWAGVTFAWFFGRILNCVEDRQEALIWAGLFVVLTSPLEWFIARRFGWAGVGAASILVLLPAVHFSLGSVKLPRAPVPLYSKAIGKLKMGKYTEAEEEVIQQLEKVEDDFEGWLMLADLYANQFGEMGEAEKTIEGLCAQPNINTAQISFALHKLSSWQLKHGDVPGARRALAEIIRRLPESHAAAIARLEMERLPKDNEELARSKEHKVHLRPTEPEIDTLAPASFSSLAEAKQASEKLVQKLTEDPNEVEARERLAVIFAEIFGKAELGIEQLELLLAMPEQPEEKSAQWLAVIARWQEQYLHDEAAALATRRKLVEEFPQSSEAFEAQRVLSLRHAEDRFKRLHAHS